MHVYLLFSVHHAVTKLRICTRFMYNNNNIIIYNTSIKIILLVRSYFPGSKKKKKNTVGKIVEYLVYILHYFF